MSNFTDYMDAMATAGATVTDPDIVQGLIEDLEESGLYEFARIAINAAGGLKNFGTINPRIYSVGPGFIPNNNTVNVLFPGPVPDVSGAFPTLKVGTYPLEWDNLIAPRQGSAMSFLILDATAIGLGYEVDIRRPTVNDQVMTFTTPQQTYGAYDYLTAKTIYPIGFEARTGVGSFGSSFGLGSDPNFAPGYANGHLDFAGEFSTTNLNGVHDWLFSRFYNGLPVNFPEGEVAQYVKINGAANNKLGEFILLSGDYDRDAWLYLCGLRAKRIGKGPLA